MSHPVPAASAASLPRDVPASEIRGRLLDHYDLRRRDLPWRRETDPYRIWVSEVMLQQTRVETVIPYYRRWVERFPDLEALASCDEDEVLAAWEGLGYYARARNLHRAARLVRDRHEGALPRQVTELLRLPGFGSYTAGAVASIAFGVRAPAVDGNVRRVLSRLYDLSDPSPAEIAEFADRLVDPVRPGDFNQALMELGATLCTPRSPRCAECPLGAACLAAARGTASERPGRRSRRPVPERWFVVFALVDPGGRTLLVRRPRGGLLGGLWAFPEREIGDREASELDAQATNEPAFSVESLGLQPRADVEITPLPEVRHVFSHFRARYLPRVIYVREAADSARRRPAGASDQRREQGASGTVLAGGDHRWVDIGHPGLALPSAQKRILASLRDWLNAREANGASARHKPPI